MKKQKKSERKLYAGNLVQAQGEQIRRMSAEEYLKNKMRSGADGQHRREDSE